MKFKSSRSHLLCSAMIVALLPVIAGCASHPVTPVAVAAAMHTPRSAARTELVVPISASASASVQGLPAYAEAKVACSQGQYRKAADILARMQRSASLSTEQKAFCRAQELICLGHLTPTMSTSIHPLIHASSITPSSDCGPRALLIACEKLGVKTNLADLTKAAGTGSKGTSMTGLKQAAEELHLKAEGVQASREALPDQSLPAIAWSQGNHFVTVLAWNGRGETGTATIHDPIDAAPKTVSQEALLEASSGYLLTLRR